FLIFILVCSRERLTHAFELRRDFPTLVPAQGWTKQLWRVKAVRLSAERDDCQGVSWRPRNSRVPRDGLSKRQARAPESGPSWLPARREGSPRTGSPATDLPTQ